jgi:5'-3' exonuclease
MGIPFYFYRICKKYNILDNQIKERPDWLYFDYNSLIHPIIHKTISEKTEIPSEEELIGEVIAYTKKIIEFIGPKNVFIAIDGVAPRAKMNQQRERRYKKIFLESKSLDNCHFDTNMITPGTPFMDKLSQYLHSVFTTVIISDASECGEGEHKIIKHINVNNNDSGGTHVIYGMDGDLIMLSLLSNRNIILFRDDMLKDKISILNINLLKRSIINHFNEIFGVPSVYNIESHQILYDYIVLCFLLGNDFLPAFANLSLLSDGIERLEHCYKRLLTRGYLLTTINGGVYILNRRGFLELLKELDQCVRKSEHKVQFRDPLPTPTESAIFNFKNFGKEKDCLYYSTEGVTTSSNWISGIEWVLGYYQSHYHKNWSWFYRYENAPCIKDTIHYLNLNLKNISHFVEDKPFTPLEQIFMVLPKRSIHRIGNQNLSKICESDDFKLYFPDTLVLDGVNKVYIWQCNPLGLIPFNEEIVKSLF